METAIEFLRRDESGVYNEQDITHAMIQFAKMHCEAQAKAIASESEHWYLINGDSAPDEARKEMILTAYPIENIK